MEYVLALTNKEVTLMFRKMVRQWFCPSRNFGQAVCSESGSKGDSKGEHTDLWLCVPGEGSAD